MDPVFTLQWPEYIVAERLRKHFSPKDGYSILIPMSRQEKGFDLAIVYRNTRTKKPSVVTIQVKASRAYLSSPPKRKKTIKYKYSTWFNCFEVSDRADFFILIGMYPPDLSRTRKVSAKWYQDCSLLFTNKEMKHFMTNCKTVRGKPDRMFGFRFDDMKTIVLTRGDMTRSRKDYTDFLLAKRFYLIKDKMSKI